MKKFFTLLLSSLFSLSLFAFDGSRLSISAVATSTQLKVEVDGRQYTMKDNSITLSYLSEGHHQVIITRQKSQHGFRKNEEVIYNSFIFLKKGFHFDITVNRFGKAVIDEHLIDIQDDWYNQEDDYYNSNNGGWSNGYSNVMSVSEFEGLKDQLRKEWFENNRVKSVKFIIDKNNFTTAQVKDLMLLFIFEDNRLDIAKYAYCKTVDQGRYYQLNDALTFTASKKELADFLHQAH